MPLVYDELRRIAARYVSRERPGHTLQPTALVNEAFIRLSSERARHFENRTHSLAIAALSMRQVLIERARSRRAAKRGSAPLQVTLDDHALGDAVRAEDAAHAVDVLALDAALTRLAGIDQMQARIVELRYFGGMTVDETAEAVHLSPATVKREWAMARAWLRRALDGPPATGTA